MAVISPLMLNKNKELNFPVGKVTFVGWINMYTEAFKLSFFFFFKRHLKWCENVENSRIEKGKSDPKKVNTVKINTRQNPSYKSIKGKKEVCIFYWWSTISQDMSWIFMQLRVSKYIRSKLLKIQEEIDKFSIDEENNFWIT